MQISIIIPVLNEAENLPHVLGAIPKGVQVVVADNGSTDDSAQIAAELGATVVHAAVRGYGSAVLAGIRALEANPPGVVVILDADGADPPQLMSRLTDPIIANQADFVLSERTRTSTPGALNTTQRFGNAFAVFLMARATGHSYRDMAPFRAIRWSSLVEMQMEDPTWGWNVEMQMKAVRLQLRILEIPLPYRPRRHGQSKISGTLLGVVRAGTRILWAVRHYNRT